MQLSKKVTFIVIGVATIALLGLSTLQIQNLRSSLSTNKQLFLQKVDLASTKISDTFLNNSSYIEELRAASHRIEKSGKLNDPQMDLAIREITTSILLDFGLDIPYEYAIYTHKVVGEGYSFVMGDQGGSLEYELIGCIDPKERGHGWANLTCSSGGNLHMALFFPSQEEYVFAQSMGALVLSITFIVLLIGCFAYTLIVIQRQKRLSTIKNDFINNLTHEFKTPIASISLATSILKSNKAEVTETKKANYLDLIDLESKRLEGQVDKVLQIAMIDSGNFTLEKKHLNIHEVINRVVDSMGLVVNKRSGKIDLYFNATNSEVYADDTHLVNIIYNLIDNALKYTTDIPQISITTQNSDQGIEISIKDNGIGIGEEIQKYIFDKFYRAETGNVQNAKGFGLGLSYVKKIIEEHKGKIGLTSTLNHGSEFRLTFPLS